MHDGAVIPLAGILMPVMLVPAVMGMRQMARKREFEHLERMKALETGRPLPGSDAWPSAVAIAIGAIVPLGSLFVGWLGSLTTNVHDGPWEVAGLVGITSILCGSVLGWRVTGGRIRGQKAGPNPEANGKPMHDADAFDVVSRRG